MTTLAVGASVTVAVRDGGTIAIATNGGLASAVVTLTEGGSSSVSFGPLAERRVLGPFKEGASVTITNSSVGSFDYDVETQFDPSSVAITGGAIRALQKLRRAFKSAESANPIDNPVASTLPTITTAFDGTLSTFFALSPANNGVYFNAYGGPLVANSLGYTAQPDSVDTGLFSVTTYEFATDAPKLQFRAAQGTFWVTVDGKPLSTSGVATAALGGEQQIVLDWTAVRKPRLYRVTFGGGGWGVRVGMDALSRMWAPRTDDVVRMYLDGDSYSAGTGATQIFTSLGFIAPSVLGIIDCWNGAVGGTGWLNAGAYTTFRSRIANVIAAKPDLVVIPGGTNDGGQTSAAVQAEVTLYLQQLRAALPNTPVVLVGPWPKATGPNAALLTVEAGILAAVTALGDPLTAFVPVCNDPAGAWIFGTGSNGTGSGNAALYIGADATHPNDAGHVYLGRYMAQKVANAVKTMATVAV